MTPRPFSGPSSHPSPRRFPRLALVTLCLLALILPTLASAEDTDIDELYPFN